MSSHRLLVLTASREDCRQPVCSRLKSALGRLFANAIVETQDLDSDCSFENAERPDLVLLRSADTAAAERHIHQLRHRFPQMPLVGIFCPPGEDHEIPISVIDELDDHLCCPFREVDLRLRLQRFLLGPRMRARCARRDFRIDSPFSGLLGESPAFLQVVDMVPVIAASDCTCLIEGATGTGKELFARAIHYLSPRRGKPFVPVNCGALPEALVENELFGHVRGAYTGATSLEAGLFAFAEDGTLFLDEVDSLSLPAQVKLLRVLQENEYRPLGSARLHKSQARVLAATNVNLRGRVARGEFREDLYHRLNVLQISIPSLSQRSDDIPRLAHYFMQLFAQRHQRAVRDIAPAAMQKLIAYPWPGNVRELESVIHRGTLLCAGYRLMAHDIDIPVGSSSPWGGTGNGLRSAKALAVERFERTYLAELMARHHGNVSHAARTAGKERRSFQRLLRKYQIDLEHYRTRNAE